MDVSRLCLKQPKHSWFQSTLGGAAAAVISLSLRKQLLCGLLSFGWMCVSACIYLRCQVSERRWSGAGRRLVVADTKPLLCNQVGVKLKLRGPLKGSQRQGAGGWGGSAVTQLWAGPTHPGSIWALLISVAAWPLFPPGSRTKEALGAPLLL